MTSPVHHSKKEANLPAPIFSDEKLGSNEQRDIHANKDIAAISYLWILSVIVYFLKRDSAFVKFHAKQGIVLFLLSLPLAFIPFVGQILGLIILAGVVIGFLNAAQGLKRDIPIVGPLSRGEISVRDARKQALDSVVRFVRAFRDAVRPSPTKKSSSKSSKQ